MAAQKKATSPSVWRKTTRGEPLDLPSGNTALVRKPDLRQFIADGVVPDALRPIMHAAMRGDDPAEAAGEQLDSQDPEVLKQFFDYVDKVALLCVVEPSVKDAPKNEDGEVVPMEERDASVLYIDEVDYEDKEAIFTWAVGHHTDLESFRGGQEEGVGASSTGDNVSEETE